MNETQEQVGPAPQAGETLIELPPHLRLGDRRAIGQMGFDIPMTIFFRVEFRRILGQRFDHNFGMIPQITNRRFAGMDRRVITDQDETFWHKATQVLPGQDHLLTLHAAYEMAFVNLARQGQTHRRTHGASFACDPSDNWTLTPRRPGASEPFLKRVTKLIKKHDVDAAPPRFF